ncbi:MAG TPA: amidohydrolase family protein [Acidimicrobiia bacterium]|nr:amidohydrolase family protein [Acidimicrobiia bacterium]
MSQPFLEVASIDYPILDADAHVNEPPDTWQARVPARLRERAPKVIHTDDGDVWSFDDGKAMRPVGLTATAGLSFPQFRPAGVTYEGMRPGSFDTKARLADLDADGIYAQVLYPSVTLSGAKTYGKEPELQLACVRAYNDWLAEFCEGSDGRLIGQGILPTTSVDDSIAEAERAVELGHRGVVISSFPNGSLDAEPDDDRFWSFAQEADLPVAVHIGSFLRGQSAKPPPMDTLAFMGVAGASKAGSHTIPVVCDLIFSGIFERFAGLKLLLVEANIGWIPTLLEQVDDMFLRYRWFTNGVEQMRTMPSRIFHRNFWATFMIDTVGIELRHRMNLEHLLWSTDYPHTGSDWPNNRVTIERNFRGLPADEVRRMLHDNCKALYRLDHIPDTLS